MGTGRLVDKAGGQTIIQDFWNDIHRVLEGDLVGHDSGGNPVAGNNLGNPAYPWGTLYLQNALVLGGVALNTSQLESQPYKTVSGRTRSGSTQPDFIRASGTTPNFTILATTTNLVLQIAGVGATWTADKTVAGTVAPSSGNTATVNDSTFTGQAASRIAGEYGSSQSLVNNGTSYYGITMSSAGTNITAKVGTWQAFKIGTEYFLAFVESTTLLTRAFRGFFLDSSGNPVKRATFSNGATITLMSLGWVFLDQDLTTVDVTYNSPTFAYSAPSSPATGDYWFDEGNQVWKRYNGSSFAVVNRTLVGLIVLDATNCVASRSFDFFQVVRADNTIEIESLTNTVAKASGLFQRVNVNGKRINFSTSRATWDTSANLAASTERYNATVQANSTEYLYVTDLGETKISDMEPYWRADLLGWYHPYNPWRATGQISTDGSGNFSTVKTMASPLPIGSITRQELPSVGQQISASAGSGSGITATTFQDVSNLSVTLVTSGRPVLIILQPDGSANPPQIHTSGAGTVTDAYFQLVRDSGAANWLFEDQLQVNGNGSNTQGLIAGRTIAILDTPAAGSHAYKMQVKSASGSTTVTVSYYKLLAFEL